MWWPAIGGLVVGIGGLIDPRVLGVGYDNIRELLQGDMAVRAVADPVAGEGASSGRSRWARALPAACWRRC